MRTFLDPNHVPLVPKMWTAPNGKRIEWRSDKQPFDQFFAVLTEYHAANNLTAPVRAEVEDAICRQLPRWACVDPNFHTVVNRAESSPYVRSSGCRSCGKR